MVIVDTKTEEMLKALGVIADNDKNTLQHNAILAQFSAALGLEQSKMEAILLQKYQHEFASTPISVPLAREEILLRDQKITDKNKAREALLANPNKLNAIALTLMEFKLQRDGDISAVTQAFAQAQSKLFAPGTLTAQDEVFLARNTELMHNWVSGSPRPDAQLGLTDADLTFLVEEHFEQKMSAEDISKVNKQVFIAYKDDPEFSGVIQADTISEQFCLAMMDNLMPILLRNDEIRLAYHQEVTYPTASMSSPSSKLGNITQITALKQLLLQVGGLKLESDKLGRQRNAVAEAVLTPLLAKLTPEQRSTAVRELEENLPGTSFTAHAKMTLSRDSG